MMESAVRFCFAIGVLVLAFSTQATLAQQQTPIVIWHGMGNEIPLNSILEIVERAYFKVGQKFVGHNSNKNIKGKTLEITKILCYTQN